MIKQIAGLLTAAALTLTVSVGTASAAAPPTRSGFVGGWNMMTSQTMASVLDTPPSGPMAVDNALGNIGMCGAVLASSGSGC